MDTEIPTVSAVPSKFIPHDLLSDFEEFLRMTHEREKFVNDRPQLKTMLQCMYKGDWGALHSSCLEDAKDVDPKGWREY